MHESQRRTDGTMYQIISQSGHSKLSNPVQAHH